MKSKHKFEDQLAHEIKDIVIILNKYCECYEQENREIETITVLTEYLLTLSCELCSRY